jgi:surface antigen|tara:strand:+ start:55 stop:591 length:537 start_codon:yes stop_codon:yes gene_type:complete
MLLFPCSETGTEETAMQTATRATAAPIAILTAAALLLSACITPGAEKQGAGTLLGAVGGALAGSKVGKGRGQLVAVAAGTLLGAFLGGEIGRSLDRADRIALAGAQQRAHAAPLGETIQWSNPDSGNYGEIRPTREGRSETGRYCREYQNSVVVNGQTQQAYGRACRQPDGSWQVING